MHDPPPYPLLPGIRTIIPYSAWGGAALLALHWLSWLIEAGRGPVHLAQQPHQHGEAAEQDQGDRHQHRPAGRVTPDVSDDRGDQDRQRGEGEEDQQAGGEGVAPGVAAPYRACTAARSTTARPPMRAYREPPSTATHSRNSGPNWSEKQ